MKVLGIDPGYERLGIAVLEKQKGQKKELVLDSMCFKTDSSKPFEERLFLVGEKINQLIKQHKPDALGIETLFLNTNQKTAMRVAEVRGVILYEASKAGVKIFEASPPQIKMAVTGYGKASKEEVIKMVKMLVSVDKNKNSDDELDAIAVAITTLASIRV